MVNDEETDDEDETTSLLAHGEQGQPIDRQTLLDILGGGSEAQNVGGDRLKRLTGQGSGLEDWGRGRVSVYDEGSHITICDEQGEFNGKGP